MYIVLQAVLAELRGGAPNPVPTPYTDFSFRMPYTNNFRSSIIPSRRDSSSMDDMTDSGFPAFMLSSKRRAVARQPGLSSSGAMDLHIDPMLASLSSAATSSSRRKQSNTSDAERPESGSGFVLVTPRSEFGSWPTTLGNDTSLDGGGSVGSIAPPSTLTSGNNGSTAGHWMLGGTGDLDTQDVSHLATVHFPELRDLPTIGENGSPAAVPNLDFLSFGSGEEWRDWGTTSDALGDGSHTFGTAMPGSPGSVRLTGF
jgi:hypothetical protein